MKLPMRIVFWGTYDTGKPRARILLRGLREAGVEIIECHADVWRGIEDKSQIRGWFAWLRVAAGWLAIYPRLVLKYLRLPPHDVVMVGYLGHLDVLVLWPFAKLRGVPVAWDAFLSLYDTVVEDRKLIGRSHPLAFFLKGWECLACRAADLVMLDTQSHADYFAQAFKVPRTKLAAVFVGTEPEIFSPCSSESAGGSTEDDLTVLFYGQFIPLHGIETILRAAQLLKDEPVRWVLVGQGQGGPQIRGMLDCQPLPKLQWVPWVAYPQLPEWIGRADVCLGIFGASAKASRVIPNKVFQILACGKPVITRDSPAIRELLAPDAPGVYLVPPEDPEALAEAVSRLSARHRDQSEGALHRTVLARICPLAVGIAVLEQLAALQASRHGINERGGR